MRRSAYRALLRSILACVLVAGLSLVARPAHAINTDSGFITGLTLASIGGAGAVVSGIGSFAYMVHREHTGGWGWLSLLSGGMTLTGGLLMAANDSLASRGGGAGAIIGVGVLATTIGIVGLTLYSPKAKRRNALERSAMRLSPLILATPTGQQVPALGIHGVF
jgi:hypothetical protein